MNNVMRVGDVKMAVTNCTLQGILSQKGFRWELSISATGSIEELSVNPFASCEYLMEPVVPVEHWRDVLGLVRVWEKAYDDSLQGPRGAVCVFNHEDIDNSKIVFQHIQGEQFRVRWTGITDVSAEYFDDFDVVEFDAECEGTFVGLKSRGLEQEFVLSEIKKWITGMDWRLVADQGHGLLHFKESSNE